MMMASAPTSALIARIRAHGLQLAQERGNYLKRKRDGGRVNWRSASSLWPDFTRG